MDHIIASETYAAERYLLGEMPPEERDEFEEHFFSCRVCGEDVQTVSTFMENARAVFREESLRVAPAKKRAWFNPEWPRWLQLPVMVPTFAALALAAITGYQSMVVIPRLRLPRSMASPVIFDGDTRSALSIKVEAGMPLQFETMLLRPAESDHVLTEIIDASGKIVSSGPIPAPGLDKPLDVYFPVSLKPGRYTFIARIERGPNAGQELARTRFEVIAKGE